ncbi:hypothetical protein MKEN_00817800 [Mycena kentingensis (nom. inval.)]|nr:hypothetical protein MKEN_00817800 [Mycena kentingensis (nom. inval.)]
MPCLARTLFLAAALFGLHAVASPLPDSALVSNSLTPVLAARDIAHAKDTHVVSPASNASPAVHASHPSHDFQQRIQVFATNAKTHAATMKRLAHQAKSSHARRDDLAFQQQCVQAADGFRANYRDFYQYLASSPGGGAGLQCLDKNSGLEELLKDIVNAHKDFLDCVVEFTAAIPLLGPLLKPIAYEVKCLIDATLDLVEVLVDCLVNPVVDLLRQLGLGGVLDAVCGLSKGLLGSDLGRLLCL